MQAKVTPEMFDPHNDPGDALADIAPWPAPVTVEDVPHALRANPIIQAYLAMSPEDQASLAASAASDAEDDEAVAAALIASVR